MAGSFRSSLGRKSPTPCQVRGENTIRPPEKMKVIRKMKISSTRKRRGLKRRLTTFLAGALRVVFFFIVCSLSLFLTIIH